MALFAGLLAPKEYDLIELSPASKPTKVVFKLKKAEGGTEEIVRELTLVYEGATENVEKVEVNK